MALVIERRLETRFEITYNSEPTMSTDKNGMTTSGVYCHFKTGTGANIIKQQNVPFSDITIIDTFGGTGTFSGFANQDALYIKLQELGFFNGSSTVVSGGVNTFLALTDTPVYYGNNGKTLIINEAENRLDAVDFYNYNLVTQLDDVEIVALLPNKILGVTLVGGIPKITLVDKPTDGTTYFSAVGGFDYNDLATQTVPLAYTTGDLQLTNDTLGDFTFLSQPPYGVTRLWDEATNTFDFTQLSIGDEVFLRIHINVTTSVANQVSQLKLLFGEGTASEYELPIDLGIAFKTAGEHDVMREIKFYIGNADWKDTPAKILFSSDASATVKVHGWHPYIIRKSVNVLDIDVSGYSEKQPYQLATEGQTVISVDPTYVSIDLYINRAQQREGSDPSDDYTYTPGTATMKYALSLNDTIDVRGYKESTDPTQAIPPIVDTYANLAALIAAQASQLTGYIYEVTDASDFTGIDSGKLWVRYLGTVLGTEADYSWEPRTASGGLGDMLAATYDPANKAEQVLTISDIIDEDDMSSNSDTKVPTQQSVKAYVDDNVGQTVYNVKRNGVLGDGLDLLDGNVTSGSATFTSGVAIFQASDVGKVIHIKGFTSTISSFTNSTTVTMSSNSTITATSSQWCFGTDDTVAIQTLLQTVFDDGGGVLYFPKSIYIINGALQTSVGAYTVNPNSQLWIPYDNSEFTDLRNRPTIELRGEFTSVLDQGSALIDRVASNRGSILRTTIQGSGTNPSVIGSQGGAPNDNGDFNRTNLFVKNISIQVSCNTSNKVTIGGFNLLFSSIANFENVTCYPHTLNLMDEVDEPDVIDCTGIIMPKINCEHINSLTRTHCGGFTHGYKLGEHATAYNAVAMCCNYGFTILETGQTACFQKISAFWCNYDINIPSGTVRAYFKISFLLSEWRQASKWFDSIALINDPDSLGIGELSFDIIEANVGLNNERFKRIGAEKVVTKPISVPPTNYMQTTTYTLKYTDGYKYVDCYHASLDQVITVPNSTDVTFDKATRIPINRSGVFNVEIVGAAGVTLEYPAGFLAEINQQYDGVELVYRGDNKWALYGALKTA